MKRYLFILSILCCHSIFAFSQKIDSLLKVLDECVEQKASYRSQRYHRIDSILSVLKNDKNADCEQLFYELYCNYSHLQADSALHYLKCLSEMDCIKTDKDKCAKIQIEAAEQYAVMGAYNKAREIVEGINSEDINNDIRLRYFHVCRTIYGWTAKYLSNIPNADKEMVDKIHQYQDSILANEPDELIRKVVQADILISRGNPKKAKELLHECLNDAKNEYVAYCYYNLSAAYSEMGDTDNQIRSLAQAAIADIKRGITEYAALPDLVKILNDKGDYRRAYDYMVSSLEDAYYCHAMLRSLEIGEIYPIIEKEHMQHTANEKKLFLYFSIGFAILTVLLAIATIFSRKEAKALSKTKAQLAETNKQLEDANIKLGEANEQLENANEKLEMHNEQLQETNISLHQMDVVKEEYIALFISKCRKYITSLESYRRSLLKLAKNNQNAELMRMLKDDTLIEAEEDRFYKDFDEAFLEIHPNFVQNFNDLLNDDGKCILKKNELLNPELRIFALIRLGITDNKQIAEFLNYSMPTIYNYRSRIRNKSKYNKDDFEEKVMSL